MQGLPNKFEIFQLFYFQQNGSKISYYEALDLYSQMDDAERSEFEQYYQDQTGYQIIVGSGYNLDFDAENAKYTQYKKGLLNIKYSLDAYAKKNGMVLDPQWAGFSAEEIIQMENEGVNIPQDVLDIAHSIMNSQIVEEGSEEDDDTTEKEPFLDLIPKAQKKIKKCNESNDKIDDKIEDLMPQTARKQKKLSSKMKEQRNSLKEFEAFVREWRHLQNKVNNGEALSTSEAERYAELMGMMSEKRTENSDFGIGIDKREIARALNDLNILAVLGEKLADETIEIGEDLEDYTCKANYKTTRNQAMGEVGLLRGLIAMAQGKDLAKQAVKIGNETKEYTDETHKSVMDIANIMEIEGAIADVDSTPSDSEIKSEQTQQEQVESEQAEEVSPELNKEESTEEATEKTEGATENNIEEDYILTEEVVKQLIDEAEVMNDDLKEQIIFALKSLQMSKGDIVFAKLAGMKIDKLVKEFQKEEERRNEEIQKLEEENKTSKEEIAEITGENPEEIDENDNSKGGQNADEASRNKVNSNKAKISENNQQIENIKVESEQAKEVFKTKTQKEKNIIDEAIPKENEAFQRNSEYKSSIIPEYEEKLDFTRATGLTFARIGLYMFVTGIKQLLGLFISRHAIWLMTTGSKYMVVGGRANIEAKKPYAKIADKVTESAETKNQDAITNLTELDNKIINITGEDAAQTPASDNSEQTEQDGGENTVSGNEEGAETTSTVSGGTTQAATASTVNEGTVQAPAKTTNTAQTPAVSGNIGGLSQGTDKGYKVKEGTSREDAVKAAKDADAKKAAENSKEVGKLNSGGTSSAKKKDEEITAASAKTQEGEIKKSTGKQEKEVKEIDRKSEDDSKESKKIQKDEKKDAKTLEKEAKKLEKQMKTDEQNIIKMTKESQDAAKKQEEILVEYETINAENDQLIAGYEAKQNAQQAVGAKPANGQEQQGAATGATNGFAMGGDNAETVNEKLQINNQKITTLSSEFKGCTRKITRNQTKIKKLEKSIKNTQTKHSKKIKLKNKKIKEQEKKEQEKQKRLSKQLAAVGIAENVFSITLSTGTVMVKVGTIQIATGTAMLLNPFTAAAGAALITSGTTIEGVGTTLSTIGTYGNVACAITKATINIANGNLTAALVGLGATAVTTAMSLTGVGSSASLALTAVTQGLNVVASSAELVNNVRAVQGKEASGVFSKISTVAGVASAVTSAASGLSNMGGQNTLGKAATIASAVGTAMSSTSQLMSEFGAGGKTADILGMIGGAVQTTASAVQIAQSFKDAKAKSDDNKQKTDEANNNENSGDSKNNKKPDNTKKPQNKENTNNNNSENDQQTQAQNQNHSNNGSGIVSSTIITDANGNVTSGSIGNNNVQTEMPSVDNMSDAQVEQAAADLMNHDSSNSTVEEVTNTDTNPADTQNSGKKPEIIDGTLPGTEGISNEEIAEFAKNAKLETTQPKAKKDWGKIIETAGQALSTGMQIAGMFMNQNQQPVKKPKKHITTSLSRQAKKRQREMVKRKAALKRMVYRNGKAA